MYKFGFFEAADEGFLYSGIYDSSKTWNGWKCPLFDYDTAKLIIESQATIEECKYYSCSFYELSDYPKGIIEKFDDGISFYPVINYLGVEYYAIGHMNWTWVKVDLRLTDEG